MLFTDFINQYKPDYKLNDNTHKSFILSTNTEVSSDLKKNKVEFEDADIILHWANNNMWNVSTIYVKDIMMIDKYQLEKEKLVLKEQKDKLRLIVDQFKKKDKQLNEREHRLNEQEDYLNNQTNISGNESNSDNINIWELCVYALLITSIFNVQLD